VFVRAWGLIHVCDLHVSTLSCNVPCNNYNCDRVTIICSLIIITVTISVRALKRASLIVVWCSLCRLTCIGSTCRSELSLSMVHNCLHHKAPRYLMDCCIPISDMASRWHLRSARRHHLVVPWHSLSLYGRRAFAVAGPAAWNSLSDDLSDPTLSTDSFRSLLKTHLFAEY